MLTLLTRENIEKNEDIMLISNYIEDKCNNNPEYIVDYREPKYLNFYIPKGYKYWELKQFKGVRVTHTPILVSPDRKIIIAPYYVKNHVMGIDSEGYSQEFIDDFKELFINEGGKFHGEA